jgi:hypothetical protein
LFVINCFTCLRFLGNRVILGLPQSNEGPKIKLAFGSSIRLKLPSANGSADIPCVTVEAASNNQTSQALGENSGASVSGAVVGAVVGVVAGLTLMTVIFVLVVRSRRNNNNNNNNNDNESSDKINSAQSSARSENQYENTAVHNNAAKTSSLGSNWNASLFAPNGVTRTNPSFEGDQDIYSSIDDDTDDTMLAKQATLQKSGYLTVDSNEYESPVIQVARGTSLSARPENTPGLSAPTHAPANPDLALYSSGVDEKTYESRTYDTATAERHYDVSPIALNNEKPATAVEHYEFLPEPSELETTSYGLRSADL